MANSQKSYSAVLSRAHLWCVILAGGLWFVSLCAILGVVIAQCGECDEAVVVCGWATEGLGGGGGQSYHSTATPLPENWCTAPEYCQSTPRVLPQYCQSTGAVLPEYWHITPWNSATVLPGYWCSTQRVLAQYSQSTGGVPIPEY